MKKLRFTALLVLAIFTFAVFGVSAQAVGPYNTSGTVDLVSQNSQYTANIVSAHGTLKIKTQLQSIPPVVGGFLYHQQVEEWESSGGGSGGCGCFNNIDNTGPIYGDEYHATNTLRAKCYTFGVESGKWYRVGFGNFNNNDIAGDYWITTEPECS